MFNGSRVVQDGTYGHQIGKPEGCSISTSDTAGDAVWKTYPVVPIQHHSQGLLVRFGGPNRGKIAQVNLCIPLGHPFVKVHDPTP